MKNIIFTLVVALGLTLPTTAQVVTAVPCDMLGMSVNVGSQENFIAIHHSGQYMTHPQSENIFIWEFTDQQGNMLHQDTIIDDANCNFSHSWPLTDTVNVTVTLVNDSANLDNWYINQGLPLTGQSINCLFEDQLFWYIDTFPNGTLYGSWTFIHNNLGVDLNISTSTDNFVFDNKRLIKMVDLLGRETSFKNNHILFYIYSDGSREKKYINK